MATNKPFEFFIQWHLTERCNLWCRHCYQGERNHEELSLPVITRTVAEASDMIKEWSDSYGMVFQPSMNITGGEPFLRHDLFDILEAVKSRGFDIYILTNGTLVDRIRAERLAELGVNGVQVSIEGPEDVHNAIRGDGSFASAAEGIERLVDCGLEVTLNVTLSRLNAGHLKSVVAFGSHIGAKRIGFSRLVPSGKGRAMLSEMLSGDELVPLYTYLFSREITAVEIVTGDPIAVQLRKCLSSPDNGADAGAVALSGCAAALSGLTIQTNGNILPCRRLPLTLGNIRKDSLREVWAASPVLEALRDRRSYKGKCGTCPRWALCRGCRAIAYAWSRSKGEEDFLSDDPQCFVQA